MTCQGCTRLQEENAKLQETVTRLERENEELRRRLAAYENPHTPPSRKRRYPARRAGGGRRYPGRPRGHPGRTRLRPRPDAVKTPPWKDRCEGCGAPLEGPGRVGHRIVEEISNPAPRQVIDFLEFGWECTECGSSTTSRHPECPPMGRFGRNVLVQAALLKFEERLPHRNVCESLERTYGLRVTPATVLDIARRVSGWLRPEYEGILHRIRIAKVVYVDETGVRVDGRRFWIWSSRLRRTPSWRSGGAGGRRC